MQLTFDQVIANIAEALTAADPTKVCEIYNAVCADNITYIGGDLWQSDAGGELIGYRIAHMKTGDPPEGYDSEELFDPDRLEEANRFFETQAEDTEYILVPVYSQNH